MKPFFGDVKAADWRRPDGLLHVYVLPPPEVLAMADAYQQLMKPHHETGLVSLQPRAFLHYTVQLIDRHVTEITDDQLAALKSALDAEAGPVEPFELTAVHGVVGVHGVTIYTEPPTPLFTALNQRVRAAVAEALGPDAVPEQQYAPVPHLSAGYGLADADSDPLIRAVNGYRPTPVTLTVDQVHLLAVDQDRAAGTFSWKALHTVDLTGRRDLVHDETAGTAR
ncbi:2'-5' RNA ligase family protein [Kribbella sp. NPDC056345]|uniref:2'-5' RNA ligase family protein n=1 Tax=Kribbella sp. NPDC056345 TaxID=3345789 RepID=UPI0035E32B26